MVRTRTQLRRSAAFTLTELLVAVVVLLVVILAVGRIFGTASQVVKNGEANSALLQEIAAFEHQMRSDFDRVSGDGFLVINCVAVQNDVNVSSGGQLLDPRQPADVWLRCDQVAFLADKLSIAQVPATYESFNEVPSNIQDNFSWGINANSRQLARAWNGGAPVAQSLLSRIYYGHGLQFPYLSANLGRRVDPVNYGQLQPWFRPNPADASQRISVRTWPNGAGGPEIHNGSQPAATDWSLARQEVLIADDGDGTDRHFLSIAQGNETDSAGNPLNPLFGSDVASSRVDVIETNLGEIQNDLRGNPRQFANDMFNFRPRAEKSPLTRDRSDVRTTLSTLSGNCSSFIVDWTWADGTGADSSLGPQFSGVRYLGQLREPIGPEDQFGNAIQEQAQPTPWFGLPLGSPKSQQGGDYNPATGNTNAALRNVTYATRVLNNGPGGPSAEFFQKPVRFRPPIAYDNSDTVVNGYPNAGFGGINNGQYSAPDIGSTIPRAIANVEGSPVEQSYADDKIIRYSVVFSFNGDEPYVLDSSGRPMQWNGTQWPIYRNDYTPWPSALRVTMVLHDSKEVIEGGRVVQFSVPLPRGVQDLPE